MVNRACLAAVAALSLGLGFFSLGTCRADFVAASINAGAAPINALWIPDDIGWLYTPSQTIVLDGVLTKFAYGGSQAVTEELYDGLPGAGGGTLLRSAVFIPDGTSFPGEPTFAGSGKPPLYVGATFAPVTLMAGHAYFIGFRNVTNLGTNITTDPGATSLGAFYYDYPGDGSYGSVNTTDSTQPILQFLSPAAAVPEPSSLLLVGVAGGLGLLGTRWRRPAS